MNTLLGFFQQIGTTFQRLSAPQKLLYSGAVVLFLGSLIFVYSSLNKPDFAPLYTGMSQNDMADVVTTLKAKKVPYQLSSNNSIDVSRDQLYEARLMLAKEGIPRGAGIGFEIFDQQKLGSTEFVQKINYQRALQGELCRTINAMDEVLESRVHLVMPEESLFVSEQKPPSAAVVLKLRGGARLEQRQIQGIVNLVASTVRGLEAEKVTILSTDGQVLYKKNGTDQPLQMTGFQMEYKSRLEEELRNKIQSMLEQVLGANKVLARASVDLDFNQVQIAEEHYDPDSSVIRSQQRSVENAEGKEPGPKGNPDAPINVESKLMQNSPQAAGSDAAKAKQFNRQRETVNYEINKVSRQVVQTPGNLKKLSVAVIVDGPYEMKADADGTTKPTFVARSAEEMKSIEEIVKKAVGYNESRGDQINVSNIPFASDLGGGDAAKADNRWLRMLKNNQKLILNILLTVLVFFFIVKPFMRKFQTISGQMNRLPGPAGALPEGEDGEQPALLELPPETHNKMTLRKKAVLLAKRDSDRATEVIRGWLREEA